MTTALRVGETPLADRFFAGGYAEVLGSTLDSARGGADPVDEPFVVGALAFVGRLTEAELLLESAARRAEPADRARGLAAGGFFLCVAHCRSGDLDRGRAVLAEAERRTRGSRDSWARALLLQGVACCHYFASAFRRAERAATGALRSAQVARFAYGQLLANDMRGHLLLRRGRHHEGLEVLERAEAQAKKLAFLSNAHAIEIARSITEARLAPWPESVALLEAQLAAEHAQDDYSRRTLLLELAGRTAVIGRAARAEELLEDAAPGCAGDPRAMAGLHLGRAHVARVRRGWGAVQEHAERARQSLPVAADTPREAEIQGMLLGAALAREDGAAATRARARLTELVERDDLYVARVWLHVFAGEDSAFVADEADRATGPLAAVPRGDAARVREGGLLGLLPEALGLEPGRRLHLADHELITEDHGELHVAPALSPRSRQALEAIEAGRGDREGLLQAVWGLGTYRPERHDGVIKTTVSRLRSGLGERRGFLRTVEGVYRLAPGVSLHCPDRGPRPTPTYLDEGGKKHRRRRRILELLGQRNQSPAELARRLRTSQRTISRDLGALHDAGHLIRLGAGPATTYRLREDPA